MTVANTGDRRGAELVQVYGGLPESRHARPPRRLLGFARVELDPGARREVEIPVSLRTLAIRERGGWTIEPGRYRLDVGRHANDPDARRLTLDHS